MTMSKQTLITSRDDKGRHAVNLFAIEYDKAKLDGERAQRLNERGGELQVGIAKLIAELSVSDQYVDEVTKSSYTYPKEYAGPKPIADQVNALAEIFGLDPKRTLEFAKNLPELPDSAEGWFAIPTVDALAAKHFPEVTDPADKYCRAVQLVHAEIAGSRKFYNWRYSEVTPNRLRVHARTVHALDLIAENQPGDILIVAAQLGMRHRGESVRRARETFTSGEFGLGSLAVGSIVLVHPERLVRWEELDMDCSGDEFVPDAARGFDRAPYFEFLGGEVEFGAYWIDYSSDGCGSVSGFLPQAS
jgi:hypothetical protein